MYFDFIRYKTRILRHIQRKIVVFLIENESFLDLHGSFFAFQGVNFVFIIGAKNNIEPFVTVSQSNNFVFADSFLLVNEIMINVSRSDNFTGILEMLEKNEMNLTAAGSVSFNFKNDLKLEEAGRFNIGQSLPTRFEFDVNQKEKNKMQIGTSFPLEVGTTNELTSFLKFNLTNGFEFSVDIRNNSSMNGSIEIMNYIDMFISEKAALNSHIDFLVYNEEGLFLSNKGEVLNEGSILSHNSVSSLLINGTTLTLKSTFGLIRFALLSDYDAKKLENLDINTLEELKFVDVL